MERNIAGLFPDEQLRATAIKESKAKYIRAEDLQLQLTRLREVWPELKRRLREQLLPAATVERVILAFHASVRREIVEQTAARRVAPYPPGHVEDADTHPIEMRTLSTLDLSAPWGSVLVVLLAALLVLGLVAWLCGRTLAARARLSRVREVL